MLFLFSLFFFFFWVSRQWDNLHLVFNWENVSWGQFFFLFFLFFSFVWSFLTKKCKKGNHIRAARVFLARCAAENSTTFFALWWHFGSQSLVWSVVRFHFNFSAHPCRLQPMVLWPVRPSVIEKSTQWWQEWILSLRPCLVRPLHCLSLPVLTLFWIDEVPCYTWPTTTWVPDVPFLSVIVRRLAPRGQHCQNKICFDRL